MADEANVQTAGSETTPAGAAPATETAPVQLTPEQQEAQSAYQRAKLLHLHNYGADPDTEIVKLPNGTDDHGKMKFKEYDFRKPADATPGEAAAGQMETPPAEEPPKPAPKPKKKVAPKPESIPAPTAEEIAAKVAEKITPPAPALAPKPEDSLDLNEEDREQLGVFAAMETNPKNKGLKERVVKFWQEEAERKREYEAENPGEVYNPEADEHKTFYAKEPRYDEREFNRVARQQAVDQAVQRASNAQGEKVSALETQLRMRDEMPELVRREMSGKAEFVTQLLPKETIEQLAGEGEFAITPESVQKLEAAVTPLEFAVMNQTAEELGVVLSELDKLSRYSKVYKADPAKTVALRTSGREVKPHTELLNFSDWLENAMATDPNNQRGGKDFLKPEEWNRRVRGGEKNLADRFYTLTDADVRVALIAEYARRGQNAIQEAKKWGDLAQKKNGTQKSAEAAAAPPPKPAAVQPPQPKIKPPSSASASDRVNAGNAQGPSEAEKVEYLQQVY